MFQFTKTIDPISGDISFKLTAEAELHFTPRYGEEVPSIGNVERVLMNEISEACEPGLQKHLDNIADVAKDFPNDTIDPFARPTSRPITISTNDLVYVARAIDCILANKGSISMSELYYICGMNLKAHYAKHFGWRTPVIGWPREDVCTGRLVLTPPDPVYIGN